MKVKEPERKERRKCLACGHPYYPDPGHECVFYPPEMMAKVYGERWREIFTGYDTRYQEMKARLKEAGQREAIKEEDDGGAEGTDGRGDEGAEAGSDPGDGEKVQGTVEDSPVLEQRERRVAKGRPAHHRERSKKGEKGVLVEREIKALTGKLDKEARARIAKTVGCSTTYVGRVAKKMGVK